MYDWPRILSCMVALDVVNVASGSALTTEFARRGRRTLLVQHQIEERIEAAPGIFTFAIGRVREARRRLRSFGISPNRQAYSFRKQDRHHRQESMTAKNHELNTPLGGKNASPKKPKTWLAKTVIRHPDPEGGASWADHHAYYTVEASNVKQARYRVMRAHCPEAYEGGGKWSYMHFAQDEPPQRAFYLGEDSAAVDVGCGYAVLWVKPVPPEEYNVLKKWLEADAAVDDEKPSSSCG